MLHALPILLIVLLPLPAAAASPGETVAVTVPPLSPEALAGQGGYRQHCGECHGPNGGGSGKGPPLVHRIYEPRHHADFSFLRAIRDGARAHHWRFGDMPAQPAIDEASARAIIRFVREVQRANGID
jgi:mono/diheme cytochrome c family protein